MRQRPIGGHAKLQARELRRIEIESDDLGRVARQERERVVTSRRNRHAHVSGLHVESFEQDVGVLPGLRVADLAEIRPRRRFALQLTHSVCHQHLRTHYPPSALWHQHPGTVALWHPRHPRNGPPEFAGPFRDCRPFRSSRRPRAIG